MSRWFVGSSSNNRFGRERTRSASVSLAFSPPEKRPTSARTMSPRKSKPPRKLRISCSRAGDRLQQRRLAGAVGTEEADAIARKNRPVEILHDGRGAVAQCHVLEPHELLCGDLHRRERELERTVDGRGGNPLHPLERLDPALRLLRLGRLRAKAVYERLQVRDLPLLLHIGGLLQRELQHALAL